ncbi:hypothetical protein AVEN_22445-1 [Araneus ventricosus]|uniref:Uncharacterized protein n=1 Tax=Araneus ventricosus TaxID=182803 RepID=A0A4Y2HRD1_ARAVE|nr:hypothetical protein AVEN_22445-1 [Araneus ventricosus]
MTRTTPELAPPLQASAPHQREGVWPIRMILRPASHMHGGSLVESGFEPATLRSRGLTTRPPRPLFRSVTRGYGVLNLLQRKNSVRNGYRLAQTDALSLVSFFRFS